EERDTSLRPNELSIIFRSMPTEPLEPPKRSRYFHNWLSLTGFVVALGGLFAFLLLFAIDLFAHHGNPYMGILAYVIAPGFMIFGLVLGGMGAWIHRRHLRKSSPQPVPHVLTIDLSRPKDKKVMAAFLGGGVLFLLLTAIGSNRTYHYT